MGDSIFSQLKNFEKTELMSCKLDCDFEKNVACAVSIHRADTETDFKCCLLQFCLAREKKTIKCEQCVFHISQQTNVVETERAVSDKTAKLIPFACENCWSRQKNRSKKLFWESKTKRKFCESKPVEKELYREFLIGKKSIPELNRNLEMCTAVLSKRKREKVLNRYKKKFRVLKKKTDKQLFLNSFIIVLRRLRAQEFTLDVQENKTSKYNHNILRVSRQLVSALRAGSVSNSRRKKNYSAMRSVSLYVTTRYVRLTHDWSKMLKQIRVKHTKIVSNVTVVSEKYPKLNRLVKTLWRSGIDQTENASVVVVQPLKNSLFWHLSSIYKLVESFPEDCVEKTKHVRVWCDPGNKQLSLRQKKHLAQLHNSLSETRALQAINLHIECFNFSN